MLSRYGWGPRSERLIDRAPQGHWRSTTFVAGLRNAGIVAPFVVDGAMTGPIFRIYVEKVLVPELQPGDVVVLDNLAAHKVAGVREAIHAAGAGLLYLPPYSPDLAVLRQAQDPAAQGRRPHPRDLVGHHRPAAPYARA